MHHRFDTATLALLWGSMAWQSSALLASKRSFLASPQSPLCHLPLHHVGAVAGACSCRNSLSPTSRYEHALFAKKKSPKAVALEALDLWDEEEEDASAGKKLSKKEMLTQMKKKNQSGGGVQDNHHDDSDRKERKDEVAAVDTKQEKKQKKEAAPAPAMSKKEAKLAAMLALEELDAAANTDDSNGSDPYAGMSKKEIKAAQKSEEKKAQKMAEKAAKKAAKKAEDKEGGNDIIADVNGDTVVNGNGVDLEDQISDVSSVEAELVPEQPKKLTMEERIRKDRPPPRIKVMEGVQPGYVSLRLENVAVTFRNQEVLKDVTWGVQTGDRVGLVGVNGGGKTTQLKILNGDIEPTTGDVVKSSKDLRVALLRQEFVDELVLDRSLKEEFMSVFAEEAKILSDLRESEIELENVGSDTDKMQEILDRMQKLQAKADAKEVYNLESRVEKIMNLMGYMPEEGSYPVRSFSGGWKMRIGLGKVLLKDPNILLLDEPSNHLDLESIEWLEKFLRSQNIPMVIVSHDREFLDQVCTKIVDTEAGVSYEYDGNYSRFLQLKKARMEAWQASYDAQEKKIKEDKQWASKFKAKQPDAAKQRLAKIEKLIKSPDYIQKPPFVGKPFRFRFPDPPRMSMEVCQIKNLSHGYGNGANPLFEDVELTVEKYDRIAIMGPNGAGKSTLLRILMGREEADEGAAEIMGANIVANYFEQNQADALDLSLTVSQTVEGASTEQSYNELRALMGQFLFKGDAVEKKVENLSGGEKSRLSLCCMMLKPANLLVLDEPTNHLDIPAKEMLEEALQNFEGSIVLISHDRYFISKVATTIVAIEDKKLVKYPGDYKYYMEQQQAIKDKVTSRYVGDFRIGSAVVVDFDEQAVGSKKKNFGGAKTANLVTRKDKGVKNAKRART